MAKRIVVSIVCTGALACAGGSPPPRAVIPESIPLPIATITGNKVAVFPATYVVAEERLGWQDAMGTREWRVARADAFIEEFLAERAPDITWVYPRDLSRAAQRAPGMLQAPELMGTAALQDKSMERLPHPLVSNMRNLLAVAGDRYALVPASIVFTEPPDSSSGGMATLTIVVADVRHGLVLWRGSGYGVADDPWAALRIALDGLLPVRK